ncbi:hypothetical protein HYQ44_015667 [Verticillium longisporum]|nr:hypothetical protein HYQ44_015667 [Verticillium longisporum]
MHLTCNPVAVAVTDASKWGKQAPSWTAEEPCAPTVLVHNASRRYLNKSSGTSLIPHPWDPPYRWASNFSSWAPEFAGLFIGSLIVKWVRYRICFGTMA